MRPKVGQNPAPANAAVSVPSCFAGGISDAALNRRAYPFPGCCAACGGGSTALGLCPCHAGKLKGGGITTVTPHSARRISTPGFPGHIKRSGCAFFLGEVGKGAECRFGRSKPAQGCKPTGFIGGASQAALPSSPPDAVDQSWWPPAPFFLPRSSLKKAM